MAGNHRIFSFLIIAALLLGLQAGGAYAAKVDKYEFRAPSLDVDDPYVFSFSDVNLTVTFKDAIAPDGTKQDIVHKITRFPQEDNYINPATKQHYTVDKVQIAGTFKITNRIFHHGSPVATVHVNYTIELDKLYHAPLQVTLQANVERVGRPYRTATAYIHADFWSFTPDLAAIYFVFDRYTMGSLFSISIGP